VGGGSPGAFRRVAALGDGWHANARTPAQLRDGLAQVWAAADAVGRAHETIEVSLRYGLRDDVLTEGAQAVIDDLAEFKRLGVRHVLVEFRRPDLARMLELLDVVTGAIRPVVDAA
jgi:alkanesulfonate monooxygenase SsuD/methylene tetrahydromethanopterin reductase-like flavin-dependent oxidoreductase (luciferase family)